MYIPDRFKENDQDTMIALIRAHGFGLLITSQEGVPACTHLAFFYDARTHRLVGHIAKRNPQAAALSEPQQVLAVFSGPHAYISPTWYEEKDSVPTWNYVAVHVYGELRILRDRDEAMRVIMDTVAYYESNRPEPWTTDLSNDYNQALLDHIVCFEIPIQRMEGAWKLNQHHSEKKQRKTIDGLRTNKDDGSQQIAAWMENNLKLITEEK